MKIAAAVILYHPDESAIANIKTYYDYVDKIFVYDNSDKESELKKVLQSLSKVSFYQDFDNGGIAKRLNAACLSAAEEQYEWMLTMDQDSAFSDEAIQAYFGCVEAFKNKASVALFGTNYDRETRTTVTSCEVTESLDLITSGSLLNLSLFKKIGGFDEALFIDSVDREYCVRSKMNGYEVLQFTNIFLVHELGKEVYRSSIKTLFLFKKTKQIHSPLRSYYMYRNMLYLEEKYRTTDPVFSKKIRRDVKAYIKKCLLYGRNTRSYIQYLKLAKKDFNDNKMGKLSGEL